jgi:hypothetical protein
LVPICVFYRKIVFFSSVLSIDKIILSTFFYNFGNSPGTDGHIIPLVPISHEEQEKRRAEMLSGYERTRNEWVSGNGRLQVLKN